jgi:ribosomal protein S27E
VSNANMVDRIVSRFYCWWYGCQQHEQCSAPSEEATCYCCGKTVNYSDMVGDTRHYRFTVWMHRLSPSRIFPKKCPDCGNRYKCDDTIDHLPF